ncbi:MAG TPA: DUF2911 domain-containing protein [Planctomycetota bacterium]|nr:DUF2911 domain-containing protein [Planctomycetota bacterium]
MIRIAIASLVLSTLAVAQARVFGGIDNERKAATTMAFEQDPQGGFKLLASTCIQYSTPAWKPEYDGMVDQAKGRSFRLGKNFWTTLNTSVALDIGGATVPAGAYYLGIKVDDEGKFHLLVLDAKNADAQGWSPANAVQWKPDHTCPLEHSKGSQTVEKLTITIDGQQTDSLELKIAWGGHVLTAPVKMQLRSDAKDAQGASAGKGNEKEEARAPK